MLTVNCVFWELERFTVDISDCAGIVNCESFVGEDDSQLTFEGVCKC